MTFLELMKQAKEQNSIIVGVGLNLLQNQEGEDVVEVIVNQTNEENGDILHGKVMIEREDMGEYSRDFSLLPFIEGKVYFQVKEVKGSTVYGTRTLVEKAEQRLLHKKLQQGEYVKAEVVGFQTTGAVLRHKSISGILENEAYTGKNINIRQFLNFSDEVEVKATEVYEDRNGRMMYKFEPKEQYEIKEGEGFTKYQVGQIVEGKVTGFIPTGMFLNIEPGVDVLSSMPASGDIEVGNTATTRITVINPENGQMRGKVVETFVDLKEEEETLQNLQSLVDEEGDELLSVENLMEIAEEEQAEEVEEEVKEVEEEDESMDVDDFEEEIRRMAEGLDEK